MEGEIAMNAMTQYLRNGLASLLILSFLFVFSGTSWAHCDTESGPVAVAAKKALKSGDFKLVAIWVGDDQADELQTRFEQCLEVYQGGGEAQELAERYFMETAVRLHREAEGMSYTGLKPAMPLPPDIAAAEKALATSDLKPVTGLLSREMERGTGKLFRKALEAKKHKDESVQKGREWVDAYVKYVIYVHGLHQKIQAGPEHGVGE